MQHFKKLSIKIILHFGCTNTIYVFCIALLLVLVTSVFTSINLDVVFTYVINNKRTYNINRPNKIVQICTIFLCLQAFII